MNIKKKRADGYKTTAAFYDHVELYSERPDISFHVDMARECGGRVLEIGCGTGRILVPVAAAGVPVWGLDVSPAMLEVCRTKVNRLEPEIRSKVKLFEADMVDFDLGERFNLVMFPFRSFQHVLAVDDQLACLQCARRHLVDGGKLIVDVFNPSLEILTDPARLDKKVQDTDTVMPDGRRLVRSSRLKSVDQSAQTMGFDLIHEIHDERGETAIFSESFTVRYFFRFELEHLLVRSGFTLEAVYSDYKKSVYGGGPAGELVFVAQKVK